MTQEEIRLTESGSKKKHWKRWGPYLSERAWGTVREDYSPYGNAWEFFSHDHARSRAYRWNEDGLAGICDRRQFICFALALWNERDPILKERIFGLTGNEGNHGEDAKEYYFYLDSTPTHSYMKHLYKYPQAEFPYGELVEQNRQRGKDQPEYELLDTGVFNDNRYFDVFVEYAKADTEDILIKITVANRGPEAANLRLMPTVWFRNTWSWGDGQRPELHEARPAPNPVVELNHDQLGNRWLHCEGAPELLFTENETNAKRLFGVENRTPYVKDGINDYVVHGATDAVNPARTGTKTAADYQLTLAAGENKVVRLRLSNSDFKGKNAFANFAKMFALRKGEADEFYATVIPQDLSADAQNVMRQGLAGMLWSKQFYHYVIKDWLQGDPGNPPPPAERRKGRNHEWTHLYNADVISMPDKWEYPWYAAWDLAFHCIPLALVDSDFAKEQLTLMLREWYMHPNGQIPAYEWAFGDVNPPVHAWAAWRVYKIDKKRKGKGDRAFLQRVFHKLMLNFTWWVNRKDADGMNIFQGGFLGLDNIGVFDRSAPLPTGGYIEQSDGTSWMAMYTLNLLAIALELAKEEPSYEDVASKFWEHFIYIAHAMSHRGHDSMGLWNEEDGFFYDVLKLPDGNQFPMKIRSTVGLIPLFAVETLEPDVLDKLPDFKRRLEWFIDNRPDLTESLACMRTEGMGERRLLSIAGADQLRSILKFMLDEREFLSPYGVRALSQHHRDHPYCLSVDGTDHCVDYQPGESSTSLFGGNSNWRGPIWFPVNFLLVESLQKFHHYLGDEFKVECPTGSGKMLTLWQVAGELSRRMTSIFLRDERGHRPVFGDLEKFQTDPHWRDLLLFHEYFHGDSGAGIGASHQTGWTGVVTKLIQQNGESRTRKKPESVVANVAAD
jgi:Mannosylglycerate hydrolase MGH1-like glycoside hydrolase domain/Glycosyl hydrolase family 63 C-terminal domain